MKKLPKDDILDFKFKTGKYFSIFFINIIILPLTLTLSPPAGRGDSMDLYFVINKKSKEGVESIFFIPKRNIEDDF